MVAAEMALILEVQTDEGARRRISRCRAFLLAPTWMPSANKARFFLKPHENHIAVLKVKRKEPLTPTDLD
jgi:hypothetical protein